jgi:hypothetical protein
MGGSRPWKLSKKKARGRYGYWPSSGGKKITGGNHETKSPKNNILDGSVRIRLISSSVICSM